ncbi:GNAT family N-acetyltransferase [Chloroflexota bacterium]
MPYTIRHMLREETAGIFDWEKKTGWNFGVHDWGVMYDIDPDGYFVGVLDGEIIGCIGGVSYAGKYGYLTLFMVRPGFRGQRYGLALWKHALHYLNDEVGVECVGLDAVLEREKDYAKWGFHSDYRITGYTYDVKDKFRRRYPPIEEKHFADIAEYDLKMFKVDRSSFIHDFIFKTDARTGVAYDGNKLVGFTIARPAWRGYKVGPVFADNAEVAEGLLESAMADLQGQMITIEIPEPNKSALKIARDYQMES